MIIAPWARLVRHDGELATARAAALAGTLIVVPDAAERSLEVIAAATNAAEWWQLYVFEDRAYRPLVAAGR